MFARKMLQSPLIGSKIFLLYYILTYLTMMATGMPTKLCNHLFYFFPFCFLTAQKFHKNSLFGSKSCRSPPRCGVSPCGLAVTEEGSPPSITQRGFQAVANSSAHPRQSHETRSAQAGREAAAALSKAPRFGSHQALLTRVL